MKTTEMMLILLYVLWWRGLLFGAFLLVVNAQLPTTSERPVTSLIDSEGKKYRTYYEGKWNPQEMIDWLRKRQVNPYDVYLALDLIKNLPPDEAEQKIDETLKIDPKEIQIMCKELKVHVVDAYEALREWTMNPSVTVNYKSGINDMSPVAAQKQMQGEKYGAFEEDLDKKQVPYTLERLANLHKAQAWVSFNREAFKLREQIKMPKKFFRDYAVMDAWKQRHPDVFKALRRFFIKGISAGPSPVIVPSRAEQKMPPIMATTTTTTTTTTTPVPVHDLTQLDHDDLHDLHDVKLSNTDRYRLVYNETEIVELPPDSVEVKMFRGMYHMTVSPIKQVKNIRRYVDMEKKRLVECKKVLKRQNEGNKESNLEICTNIKYFDEKSHVYRMNRNRNMSTSSPITGWNC